MWSARLPAAGELLAQGRGRARNPRRRVPRALGRHLRGASLARRPVGQLSRLSGSAAAAPPASTRTPPISGSISPIGAARAVVEVDATLDFVRDGRVDYDRLCLLNMRTENGLVGRCVQDVVTQPPRKWARVQGATAARMGCGSRARRRRGGQRRCRAAADETEIRKTRPDDFIEELRHIDAALAGGAPAHSPIALDARSRHHAGDRGRAPLGGDRPAWSGSTTPSGFAPAALS